MSRPGYIDKRGNNESRRRRRTWLLATFDEDLGPGRARCHLKISALCERIVDEVTLTVDRIQMGGSYRRGNIQPACRPCQDRQGGLAGIATQDELLTEYRAARDQWVILFDLHANTSYYPGIIEEYRRKARRGGRNEVVDFVDENPPPVLSEWLEQWHAARRQEAS